MRYKSPSPEITWYFSASLLTVWFESKSAVSDFGYELRAPQANSTSHTNFCYWQQFAYASYSACIFRTITIEFRIGFHKLVLNHPITHHTCARAPFPSFFPPSFMRLHLHLRSQECISHEGEGPSWAQSYPIDPIY